MESVLGVLRRKKTLQAEVGPLPILLCTEDGLVGGHRQLRGEQGSVTSEKRQPGVGRWSGASSVELGSQEDQGWEQQPT